MLGPFPTFFVLRIIVLFITRFVPTVGDVVLIALYIHLFHGLVRTRTRMLRLGNQRKPIQGHSLRRSLPTHPPSRRRRRRSSEAVMY